MREEREEMISSYGDVIEGERLESREEWTWRSVERGVVCGETKTMEHTFVNRKNYDRCF